MLGFIGRRLGVLVIILLGSSYLLYNLAAISADPLEGLRISKDPRAKQMILALTRDLQLDVPPPIRYFSWLKGVVTKFDFGMTREAQSVAHALGTAIPTTIRLVLMATVIAIMLGIFIGIITALRQYSGFDYAMTFVAFLLFSLPIFWVAVLLKQYLAISFNDFLAEPIMGRKVLLGFSAFFALFGASAIGGERKKFYRNLVIIFAGVASLLWVISTTQWLGAPFLGPWLILLLGVLIALGVTQLSVGIGHRPSLYASLTMAAIGFALYWPMQTVFQWENRKLVWPLLLIVTIAVATVTGLAYARIDKGPVIRTAILTAIPVSLLLILDRAMFSFPYYVNSDAVGGRPVPTTGEANPLLENPSFWMNFLDVAIHMVLPTLALLLISFAGYIRYARGTLLEVLNQDYIRTARAKGLPERTVIMRHAFRNTLIPLTTIMVVDFAGVIGGAIITERVFAWKGMGSLFNQAISSLDLNLLMGVFFVTASLSVLANLVADLLYSALDPRIRVGGN